MKKSNKVSWASGPNLCQVKHFREEDSPSEVGRGSQHHLQLNRTCSSIIRSSFEESQCLRQSKERHPSIVRSSSEGRQCLKQSKVRLSHRSLAKWKCPPKFNLNEKWCVVAGEESKEAENQEHREKRVLEAVYPSRSAIPSNPYTSLELGQYYDDSQTPVIRIIPIEEEADAEVPFHLTSVQTISSKLPDTCIPNSPSSVSIGTSQKLPANGKSVPQSLSTFQNPRKPPSNSLFSVRWPSNVQSAPPLSRCQNMKGSSQTQVSPKTPPVSYNSVPRYWSLFKNLSTPDQADFFPDKPANRSTPDQIENFSDQTAVHGTPDQTEIFPDKPANQNHASKCRTACENQNISQLKPQVSGMPPANHNPVTQFPSTCANPNMTVAVAVAALAKALEQGSLIDSELLVNLLLNPGEIPKLMSECQTVIDLKQIGNPITEYQASHAGSGPISGPKPVAKSGPLTMTKPETSVKSSLANEQRVPPQILLNPGEIPKLMSERRMCTDPEPDKVITKPITEYQASHAGSGLIFGPKPISKSGSLTMTKPDKSVKSNLAHEQGPPLHVGTVNIRGSKPLVNPTSDLNLEKVKKLINEYGVPDNVGGKPLFNSDLVSSSFSKCDVVLSRADLPTTLQPELQISPLSPNAGHRLPFSSMTGPASLHETINYCKSLIKEHGDNSKLVVDEHLQNNNSCSTTRGPGLLDNRIPNQRSLKHCNFFNKPGGCFNGASCPFVHELSGQRRPGGMLEDRDTKRMR
ncbi:unnamed protein product [Withania somnifera]